MKKNILILALLCMVMGAPLFAHNAGDIAINPEVRLGLIIPDIKYKALKDPDASVGFDWGVGATGNYFFFPWLSANAGLGLGGFIDGAFYNSSSTSSGSSSVVNTYVVTHLSIPFGVRLNARAFVAGLGLIPYIPLSAAAEYTGTSTGGGSSSSISAKDDKFKAKPFLGGYLDIGFDLGGRDEKTHGFGMVMRLGTGFADPIASSENIDFSSFKHINVSLIFNYMFRVANVRGN